MEFTYTEKKKIYQINPLLTTEIDAIFVSHESSIYSIDDDLYLIKENVLFLLSSALKDYSCHENDPTISFIDYYEAYTKTCLRYIEQLIDETMPQNPIAYQWTMA